MDRQTKRQMDRQADMHCFSLSILMRRKYNEMVLAVGEKRGAEEELKRGAEEELKRGAEEAGEGRGAEERS